jgi:hypothetical protein
MLVGGVTFRLRPKSRSLPAGLVGQKAASVGMTTLRQRRFVACRGEFCGRVGGWR